MSSRRKSRTGGQGLFAVPVLPFLSIMLGLMSAMALTTMAITFQKRTQEEPPKAVELVGIPHEFIPFHVRCRQSSISWLDERGKWHTVQLIAFLTNPIANVTEAMQTGPYAFINHLRRKSDENARLSYGGRQNSLILWVEPNASESAQVVQLVVAQLGFPLRVGQLPILEHEDIPSGGLLINGGPP